MILPESAHISSSDPPTIAGGPGSRIFASAKWVIDPQVHYLKLLDLKEKLVYSASRLTQISVVNQAATKYYSDAQADFQASEPTPNFVWVIKSLLPIFAHIPFNHLLASA